MMPLPLSRSMERAPDSESGALYAALPEHTTLCSYAKDYPRSGHETCSSSSSRYPRRHERRPCLGAPLQQIHHRDLGPAMLTEASHPRGARSCLLPSSCLLWKLLFRLHRRKQDEKCRKSASNVPVLARGSPVGCPYRYRLNNPGPLGCWFMVKKPGSEYSWYGSAT
jgi:hypothetical protein